MQLGKGMYICRDVLDSRRCQCWVRGVGVGVGLGGAGGEGVGEAPGLGRGCPGCKAFAAPDI